MMKRRLTKALSLILCSAMLLSFPVSAKADTGTYSQWKSDDDIYSDWDSGYDSYSVYCYGEREGDYAELTWYDYSDSIDGFYIYKSKNNAPFTRIADVPRSDNDKYSYLDYIGTSPSTYKYAVITYKIVDGIPRYHENFEEYSTLVIYMPEPVLTTKSKSEVIKWNIVDGASYYKIIAEKSKISKYSYSTYTVATIPAGKQSYTVKNVNNLTYKYFYYVIAYDYLGNEISRTPWAYSNDGKARFRAAKKKKNLKTVKVINTRVKKNKVAWTETLSSKDKKILKNFAKKHFKSGWSDLQKAQYTLNWINKNVKYATGRSYDKISNKSYVEAIFVSKKGQCLQYNGAYAMFLTYLGYEARIIQGWRGTSTKNKWSHYWCEMKVDGNWYLMETGNYGQNGSWSFFCCPYTDTHYGNARYIMNNKKA